MNREMIWYGKVKTEKGLKKLRGHKLWNGKEIWDLVQALRRGKALRCKCSGLA
jgi:hypothetical protein